MNNFKNLQYFKKYESYFQRIFKLNNSVLLNLIALTNIFIKCKKRGGKVFFLGNGGSAAIASHVAVDLTKNAGITSVTFNEVDLITCFANDFGYENWMQKSVEYYTQKKDLIVLISSSGKSKNLLNSAKWLKKENREFVTLTGMSKNNELKKINSNGLNLWVNAKQYNFIEMTHLFYLLSVTDKIIGTKF